MPTRAQIRTRTLRRADAVGSPRWDTTAGSSGEVDQILGLAFDKEWRRILNANRYYRYAKRTPTSNSSGRYVLSDLDSGSGDTVQRLYRIIKVVIDDILYKHSRFDLWPQAEDKGWSPRVWWREGDDVFALPKQASKAATGIYVNHIPARIDNLSADTVNITFPDGYEDIGCLEAAALILSKGGAETQASSELKALAEEMRADMLQDIARLSTEPLRFEPEDSAMDWAG